MNAITSERNSGSPGTLVDPDGQFPRAYNRESFLFKHALAGHPYFELESLVALTRRMPDHGEHYWANGKVAVNHTWSDGTVGRQSLQDTITNIHHNNSIVVLRHTEQDDAFAPLLQSVLDRIIDLVGEDMLLDVALGEVLILASSPGRVTPYHMNSETNFLIQVRGDQWFHVFDHNDRSLVSNLELEDFFSVSRSTATYRPDRQNDCKKYDVTAGYGVHVPSCAPHWVQNGGDVSVALSINYELRSIHRLEKLYRINRRLRNMGLHPVPPNNSEWRDRIKLVAKNGLATLRSVVKERSPPPRYRVWTPPPRVKPPA